MYDFENDLLAKGYKHIAGVDEVGRGPLAAGVLAAAVVLNPEITIPGLDDSKKLSEKKRKYLAEQIEKEALGFAFGYVGQAVIDEINIYQASKLAMMRALKSLKVKYDFILVDAMPLKEMEIPHLAIIKGDSLSASIAAASIIAKVKRDEIMEKFDKIYPVYCFGQNKGYPTKKHLDALEKNGPCPLHRRTYKPVQDTIYKQIRMEGFDEI
jgi:ribonuclease HII